jgi:hypothetical protein
MPVPPKIVDGKVVAPKKLFNFAPRLVLRWRSMAKNSIPYTSKYHDGGSSIPRNILVSFGSYHFSPGETCEISCRLRCVNFCTLSSSKGFLMKMDFVSQTRRSRWFLSPKPGSRNYINAYLKLGVETLNYNHAPKNWRWLSTTSKGERQMAVRLSARRMDLDPSWAV